MKKSKQYLEWRKNVRKEKWNVAMNIIKIGLFIFDLCV